MKKIESKKNFKKLSIVILDLDDIKNSLLNGGQARATYEVGKRLVGLGHKVTVLCSKYPGYQNRTENGIEYRHIGVGVNNIKINNALFIITAPFYVKKIKNADVIIECFTAPVSTLFSPLFTKTPVIALPSMFNAMEFTKKYNIPFHWIERLGMKFYKYVMPYSEIDAAKAVHLNKNITYKIISQGVDVAYLEIKQKPPKHILFLGRFDIAQKGIDLLLQAYKEVEKQIKYPLILAGHGPDENKIRKIIKDLELERKVTIVGSAYGEKKFNLMSEALFVAFPSRHDEMCLWALEALASGLPLIGFDLPESKWMNNEISLKAKSFDIDEYSKNLLKGTNPYVINRMRIASRKFANKYSWEKVTYEFEKFIKMVVEKERGN